MWVWSMAQGPNILGTLGVAQRLCRDGTGIVASVERFNGLEGLSSRVGFRARPKPSKLKRIQDRKPQTMQPRP